MCRLIFYRNIFTSLSVQLFIKKLTNLNVEVEVEGLENKTERGLAFLDTLSVINEDGLIKTRMYRKEKAQGPIPQLPEHSPLGT